MARTVELVFGTGTPSVATPYFGASLGPNAQGLLSYLNPPYVRTFNTGQLGTAQAAGCKVCHSNAVSLNFADTTNSNYISLRNSYRTEFATIADKPDQTATARHEPENDMTYDQWMNIQINFGNDVLAFVNSTRQFPLRQCAIFQGATFLAGSSHYIDNWFSNPQVKTVMDKTKGLIGLDCYNSRQGITTGYAWAQANGFTGQRWCVPEWGSGTGTQHSDASQKTAMTQDLTFLNNAADPAFFFLAFNNYWNTLIGKTNGALAVGDNQITFVTSSALPTMDVILERGTAKEETVTLTSTISGSGNNDWTFGCTSIQKSHASGCEVTIRPKTFDYYQPFVDASKR